MFKTEYATVLQHDRDALHLQNTHTLSIRVIRNTTHDMRHGLIARGRRTLPHRAFLPRGLRGRYPLH